MTIKGHIKNGTVVLDESVALPEGAAVTVEISPTTDDSNKSDANGSSLQNEMLELAKWAETQPTVLPSDFAENHDHYLHGLPKRK
jgi:hypothetical protein